ncbi:MAG: RelA/SpoT family protein [Bacteroidales bacterium]|jgi:GTP pyrophosphokinase|nr:RelA/SpoT family protein [Bacteroidales bacterium]
MRYIPDLVEEKKETLKKYRRIKHALNARMPLSEEDKENIKKSFHLALSAHKDMRRKSGEPYIYHPLEVAYICVTEIGLGATSVICALLHDVVEDADYTIEDIRSMFGDKVALIIDGLTKVSDFLDLDAKAMTAINIQKIVMALVQDVRVILIKLADRLHNMRTLASMPEQKQIKISKETTTFFAPLAHRLGLYAIKNELEDLALKYINPVIYNEISKDLEAIMEKFEPDIHRFIYPIKRSLSEARYKVEIKSRAKSISSIYDKMLRKQLPFEEIYDILAIRILLDVPAEDEKRACWEAYSIVTNHYRPKPGRLRDWISTPKSNGYQALHTTVMSQFGRWVEVQIRSTRMDEIAEKGYAAHWKYKENFRGLNSGANMENWLNRIREMLGNDQNPDAIEFVENLLGFLFVDEVFVFTPKGEPRILPNGSTVLDFAYAIHTELGNKCIGGEVNHQLKPISYQLRTGDQVKVLDSNAQNPDDEWLKIAITTRARTSIINALKEQKRQYAPKGERGLQRIFRDLHIEWNSANRERLVNLSGKKSLLDLYYDVALSKFTLHEAKVALQQTQSNWLQKLNPFNRKHSSMQEISIELSQHLNDAGSNTGQKKDFIVDPFCHPIPGDDIIAVATLQNVPMIHRAGCKKITEIEPSKDTFVVKTLWNESSDQNYLTGIYLDGFDRKGFIFELSDTLFQELDVNIKSFDISADNGVYACYIMLYVKNTKQLQAIINRLKKVDGIKKVYRINNRSDIANKVD